VEFPISRDGAGQFDSTDLSNAAALREKALAEGSVRLELVLSGDSQRNPSISAREQAISIQMQNFFTRHAGNWLDRHASTCQRLSQRDDGCNR